MRQARVLALMLAAAGALAAGACVDQPATQNGTGTASTGGYQRKTKKAGEPVYIGFSMDTLKEERWQRDKALVEAARAKRSARSSTCRSPTATTPSRPSRPTTC